MTNKPQSDMPEFEKWLKDFGKNKYKVTEYHLKDAWEASKRISEQSHLTALAEQETKSDIACDKAYIDGLKAGWNLCAEGSTETFNNIIEKRLAEIREAKQRTDEGIG